jgi:hypothetical protein
MERWSVGGDRKGKLRAIFFSNVSRPELCETCLIHFGGWCCRDCRDFKSGVEMELRRSELEKNEDDSEVDDETDGVRDRLA